MYIFTMSTISTITELLKLSNSQYRIYDVGRKIDKLSKEYFEKIENNQVPYPFPSQAHAFLAISFCWRASRGRQSKACRWRRI